MGLGHVNPVNPVVMIFQLGSFLCNFERRKHALPKPTCGRCFASKKDANILRVDAFSRETRPPCLPSSIPMKSRSSSSALSEARWEQPALWHQRSDLLAFHQRKLATGDWKGLKITVQLTVQN